MEIGIHPYMYSHSYSQQDVTWQCCEHGEQVGQYHRTKHGVYHHEIRNWDITGGEDVYSLIKKVEFTPIFFFAFSRVIDLSGCLVWIMVFQL